MSKLRIPGTNPPPGRIACQLKDPAALIVPCSSIAAEDPVDANMKRSVDPLARATVPLNGRTRVVGGFCQELVEVTREPSESTSMCAVRTWPLASDPPVHASALVRCTVKDQFPAAWAAVRPPSPGSANERIDAGFAGCKGHEQCQTENSRSHVRPP